MQKNQDLTSGNVLHTLVTFTLPYLLSMFLQVLYGAVDLFVVGQFAGSSAVSAVSVGSQIMHMVTVMVVGLSMGGTVRIAMRIGMRELEGAARAVGNTVLVFAALALLATPALLIWAPDLVSLVRTPAEAVAEAREYVYLCAAGLPFIIAYNIISSIFRGVGDSRTPMYFIGVACAVNVALDFLLVGAVGMGVSGAALATVAAQAVSSVAAFLYLRRRGLGFPVAGTDFRPRKDDCLGILQVGVPISLQEGLIQVSFIVITVIANVRGLTDSAAVGVVEKIIGFVFLVPSAFLSSITAMTAQNIGAGLPERAVQAAKYGMGITAGFGALVCLLSQIAPQLLTGIFSRDALVVAAGAAYLRTYSIDCILAAFAFCINGYLCGCGKSVLVFVHNLLAILLVRIPVAYCMSVLYPDTLLPMGIASPGGSLLSVLICCGYFLWMRWRRNRARGA
jgi:putative MATE family efflux protein